jgi:hypothetical protein
MAASESFGWRERPDDHTPSSLEESDADAFISGQALSICVLQQIFVARQSIRIVSAK